MGYWTYSAKPTQGCTTQQNASSGYGPKTSWELKLTTVSGDNSPMTKIDFTERSWLHVGKKMAQQPLRNLWCLLQFIGNYQKRFPAWENEENNCPCEGNHTHKRQTWMPHRGSSQWLQRTPTWMNDGWEKCLGAPSHEGRTQQTKNVVGNSSPSFHYVRKWRTPFVREIVVASVCE